MRASPPILLSKGEEAITKTIAKPQPWYFASIFETPSPVGEGRGEAITKDLS